MALKGNWPDNKTDRDFPMVIWGVASPVQRVAGVVCGFFQAFIWAHFFPQVINNIIISDKYEQLRGNPPADLKSFLMRKHWINKKYLYFSY